MKTLAVRLALMAAMLCSNAFAIPGDYTGDGKADLVVAEVNRTASKTAWSVLDLAGNLTNFDLNAAADYFVPGDYDGDGKTEPAIVSLLPDSTLEWRILGANGETVSVFGVAGDRPLAGDFDCDGLFDKAVARPTNGRFIWYFELSSGMESPSFMYGRDGDTFYASDIRGRACDDIVIARTPTAAVDWYYRGLTDTWSTLQFGLSTDRLLAPSDVDGDGLADFMTVRDEGGTSVVQIRMNAESSATVQLGNSSALALVGRFSDSNTLNFGFYQRSSSRTPGLFTIMLTSGQVQSSLGGKQSYLIRPDGTVSSPDEAAGSACGAVVSIDALRWVLYKPSNLQGGRGPTFLVQNPGERTNKRRIAIKNVNCKLIGYFGLYRTDYPYGSRYYQKSGGSGLSAEQLTRLASKAGSTAILVEGRKKWIKVNDPRQRQGTIKN